jgi:hypothetical protein
VALADSYATLSELKDRLGITDTTDDARLTNALATASRGIEKCTHRQFNDAGSVSARVFEPDDTRCAQVDDFSTTTGLVVETDPAFSKAYGTVWTTSDYLLKPLNNIVDGEPGWPYWRIDAISGLYFPIPCSLGNTATVRVTARWGWTAVPAGVKEACLVVAEETAKLKDAPFGVAGYGEYGAVRVRENPLAFAMIAKYVRDPVLVA